MRLSLFAVALILVSSYGCTRPERSFEENKMNQELTPAVATKSSLQKTYFLKHDFGVMEEGEVRTCSLALKNDRDKAIAFTGNQTSCGACLSVKSMPKEIAPGETGVFELEFNTKGKRGATLQNAAFWDGDPKTVLVVADITAVVQSIWSDPNVVTLGHRSSTESYRTGLYVMAAASQNAHVVSAQTKVPWLTLKSMPVETSDNLKKQQVNAIDSIEIEWTGTDAIPGELTAEIVIMIHTDQQKKTITVPVNGYLAGDVDIVPAQIVFGQTSTEEIVRTCVLAFQKGKIDPEKIILTASHSNVQMKLEKSGDNPDKFLLTVKWLPTDKTKEKLIEGTILGRDISGKTVLSIPYIAYQNDL